LIMSAQTFRELHSWSCENRVDFWGHLWKTQNWIHEGTVKKVVDPSVPISEVPRWFEGVKLNWAENFLWSTGPNGERSKKNKSDDKIAATEVREGNSEVTHMTWAELRRRVEELAKALSARGVGAGDRVVVVGAHSIQTLIVFLATTWLGGVFSSSSTDMGIGGLLQRTVQIDPKASLYSSLMLSAYLIDCQFVFFDDAALYNGKTVDLRDKVKGVTEGMKDCRLFQKTILIQRFDKPYDTSAIPRTERLEDLLASTTSSTSPPIVRLGFQDPLMVYYSSGTTGTPKAIVHGVGPLLMSIHKDGYLHRDTGPSDVGLQYTTTGWIMYLASVAPMALGARAVLYDGSPFVPDLKVLLRVAEEQKVTQMGVSPRWMGELMKAGIAPRDVADLSRVKLVTSTGMVLPDQLFEWFYDVGFPKKVHLANISGGTDIVSASGFRREVRVLTCSRPVALPWTIRSTLCMSEAVRAAASVFLSRYSIMICPKAVRVSLYLTEKQATSSRPGPFPISLSFSGTTLLPQALQVQAPSTPTPISHDSATCGLKVISALFILSPVTFISWVALMACSTRAASASAALTSMRYWRED
jgi:acetoacetyl-CoA synthetase